MLLHILNNLYNTLTCLICKSVSVVENNLSCVEFVGISFLDNSKVFNTNRCWDVQMYLNSLYISSNIYYTAKESLTERNTFVVASQSQLLYLYFFLIFVRDYCWKDPHTASSGLKFQLTQLAPSCVCVGLLAAGTQVHKIQCHLFPQIPSLSPSCHLSSWQHKVIASRCNQDYMLVTHSVHTVPYDMWNRHKIKPVHRRRDKMRLNMNQFSHSSNKSPEYCRH